MGAGVVVWGQAVVEAHPVEPPTHHGGARSGGLSRLPTAWRRRWLEVARCPAGRAGGGAVGCTVAARLQLLAGLSPMLAAAVAAVCGVTRAWAGVRWQRDEVAAAARAEAAARFGGCAEGGYEAYCGPGVGCE